MNRPVGVPYNRREHLLSMASAAGKIGGKTCLRWPAAERALRAVIAARARHGKEPWPMQDKEAFREGWKLGYEQASGWK